MKYQNKCNIINNVNKHTRQDQSLNGKLISHSTYITKLLVSSKSNTMYTETKYL